MPTPEEMEAASVAATEKAAADKAESDGKWESLSDQVKAMNTNFTQLADVLIRTNTPAAEAETPTSELTPEQLEERILKKAEGLVSERLTATQAKQSSIQSTLVDLNGQYPEIANPQHPMNKKMVDFHAKLPTHLRDTAEGYKMAALQAAAETGTLPVGKRPEAEGAGEDFSFGGNSTSTPKRKKTEKLSSDTLDFARVMGVDVESKEVVERMTGYANRNFNRYR